MSKVVSNREKRPKTGGRRKGTLNVVTRDVRAALRDLAEANAPRVQEWLDQTAKIDPAEATRLWLALIRFVTPTLAAAAVADITPKLAKDRVLEMTDEELMQEIINSHEAAELVKQGVRTEEELLLGLIGGPRPRANSLARQAEMPESQVSVPEDEDLLR
jgi:DNA-directed RNA polymerase subunit F